MRKEALWIAGSIYLSGFLFGVVGVAYVLGVCFALLVIGD